MPECGTSLQICIFDMSRGQEDGHEVDKILYFFPTECPLTAQLSLVGLAEGLITFTKIFSPEAPCEKIESECKTHVFLQPEEDIWMVMVLELKKDSAEFGRYAALRAVLEEAHHLFCLFYGSVRALLSKYPSGDVARSCLHAFFPDYLSDYVVGKKLAMPSNLTGLQERGMIQMIPLERSTALEVQSVVDLFHSWFGSGRTRHTLILFQDLLVSTTLHPGDAVSLFTYAKLRLLPATISATSSGRNVKKSQLSSVVSRNSETKVSGQSGPINHGSRIFTPRPMQKDKWWRDSDGFLVTDAWGIEDEETSAIVPTVWLHLSEERLQFCVYQQKSLTVIMLISATYPGSDAEGSHMLRNQILEKASPKLNALEGKISREYGGGNATHVPGYRYLRIDNDSRISVSSPSNKVATLSKESLVALDKVRAEVDLAKRRSERQKPLDLETCVRTKSNAWVVVRIRGNHELYLVMERASETLLLTCEATEKFSRRYCNGVFASD